MRRCQSTRNPTWSGHIYTLLTGSSVAFNLVSVLKQSPGISWQIFLTKGSKQHLCYQCQSSGPSEHNTLLKDSVERQMWFMHITKHGSLSSRDRSCIIEGWMGSEQHPNIGWIVTLLSNIAFSFFFSTHYFDYFVSMWVSWLKNILLQRT